MIEISVKMSNDDVKFTKKFLNYQEGVVLSKDDPVLNGIVANALNEFKGEVKDVFLTIRMAW